MDMGLETLAAASCSGSYDPEMFGAKCSKCYLYKLRQGGPVPPEINPGSKILVTAEGPGEDEVKFNRPLIGKSGMETIAGLASVGLARSQVSLTNSFSCRPPGNNLDALLLRMKKENKERTSKGLEPYLSPMEACRPRFVHELRHFQDVISLGKPAFQSLTGTNQSIMDARGMPLDGYLDGSGKYHTTLYIPEPGETVTKLRVLPTVHPAFVLRKKRWRGTFRVDLSRAVRWFVGDLDWKEPQSICQPSPQQLEEFLLKERHPYVVYDVETGSPNLDMPHLGKEPLLARLRCIGFSTAEFGMVVPFLSIDGVSTFYPSDEQEAINEICRAHFLDPKVVKAGHNINYYDRLSIETNLGVTPAPTIDTIMLHRAVESELPHRLGYVGTVWTNITKQWKTEHTAISAKTDKDLWDYNFTDDIVTARILEPLMTAVAARKLTGVVAIHHELQGVCAGLHRNGLFIDHVRRKQHDVWLQREAALHRQSLRQIIGEPGFNPNSRDQVAEVLFDRWGLTPEIIYENDPSASKKIKKAYTAAGSPSTGDDNLRAMLLHCTRNSDKWSFVNSLRKFRGAVKLRGTNIIPLRPIGEPYYEADDLAINLDVEEEARAIDEWDDSQTEREHDAKGPLRRLKLKEKKPGLVLFDGRVHPHWNAHTATTQRFASSEPNGQNWSRKIRDIVHAQQVHDWITTNILINGRTVAYRHPEKFTRALIAADMDQLELRFAAALAGAVRYLEVFRNGGDPHAVTCEMLYGAAFKHASEEGKKRLRDFAKRFSYAVLYKATVETVHETLASSENDAGELVFPDLTLRETRNFHERWLRASPEFGDVDGSGGWWLRELEEYRRQGFLVEPVFGWRRDFLDGEEDSVNEIVNFKCQCVPGFTRVLTKDGYIPIDQLQGKRFGVWTGKRWAWATAFQKGEATLQRVNTDRGVKLYADETHKLLAVGKTDYEWRALKDWGTSSTTRIALDLARPLEFGAERNVEDAYALGFWLAEGHTTEEGEGDVGVHFSNNDKAKIDRIAAWAEAHGMRITKDTSSPCTKLAIYVGGRAWLKSWGADEKWSAHTKRVPEGVWRASLACRKAFLRGFLDGDGAKPLPVERAAMGRVRIRLCQRELLEDLWLVLRTVGVDGGGIYGPHVVDKAGHVAYSADFSAAMAWEHLGWGRPAKLRVRHMVPWWVAQRALRQDRLKASTRSDAVILSRLRRAGKETTNPYILNRLGGEDLYDHASVTSISNRRVQVPVYTLSVEDPDHQYVAEGFVSKNSGGSAIVHLATLKYLKDMPFGRWGPGTGLIQQGHDALMVEVPATHGPTSFRLDKYGEPALDKFGQPVVDKWCPKGCKCPTEIHRRELQEVMTVDGRPFGLPVVFTSSGKAGFRWSEV